MADNKFKVRKGLEVNGSGSIILDVQGSQGQLFSVTDSLSGSLFSVSDISGIPIMEVFSDDTVKLGTFGDEGLVVDGNQVGIGTDSPQTQLHINGSDPIIRLSNSTLNSAQSGRIEFSEEPVGSSEPRVVIRYKGDDNRLDILTGSPATTERLSILRDNGNVGIGDTSPSTKLEVNGVVTATGGNSTQWNAGYDRSPTSLSYGTNSVLTLGRQVSGNLTATIDRIASIGTTTAPGSSTRDVRITGVGSYNVNNNSLGDSTPSSYWSVLDWGQGIGGMGELAVNWIGGGGQLWYRSLRDTTDDWWTWRRIYDNNYHPEADTLTTARTISLGGDLSGGASFDGSSNITITATIGSNAVALGTNTTGNYVATTSGGTGITVTGGTGEGSTPSIAISSEYSPNTATSLGNGVNLDTLAQQGDAGFYHQLSNAQAGAGSNYPAARAGSLLVQRGANAGGYGTTQLYIDYSDSSMWVRSMYGSGAPNTDWQEIFTDSYHPNADTLTTARNIALSGDVSGNANFDGSSNITITTTVANDSHTHDSRYYTEAESDSRFVNESGDTMTGTLTYTLLNGPGTNSRDKVRVYNSSLYTIGMQSGTNFGHLDDWSMTFQMNSDNGRGFWWGDDVHTTSQGAMSLTTNGRLTVANSISVGQGESVTNPQTDTLYVGGTADINGDVLINDQITYRSDLDTYMQFHASNQWRVVTGGAERLEVTNGTTTITNNLNVNGNLGVYGNQINFITGTDARIRVTDSNPGSQGAQFIFDGDGANNNARVYAEAFQGDWFYHNGDENTYIQFHASDQWRVVTGGTQRLEVNNTTTTISNSAQFNSSVTLGNGTSAATLNIEWDDSSRMIRLNNSDVLGTGFTTYIDWQLQGVSQFRMGQFANSSTDGDFFLGWDDGAGLFGTPRTAFWIDGSAGRVGIQTNTPSDDTTIGSTLTIEDRTNIIEPSGGFGGSGTGALIFDFISTNRAMIEATDSNNDGILWGVSSAGDPYFAPIDGGTTEFGNEFYFDQSSTVWRFETTVTATGDIIANFSDDRLKIKMGNIENPIDKIKKLSGFYYKQNDLATELGYEDKGLRVGVSAQDVQSVLPEIVTEAPSNEEYLTVQYEKLAPLFIESIKEQQSEIDELKKENKDLKEELLEIKEMLQSILNKQ